MSSFFSTDKSPKPEASVSRIYIIGALTGVTQDFTIGMQHTHLN